jgi:molecular chaperone GrpE (heat shock protein)
MGCDGDNGTGEEFETDVDAPRVESGATTAQEAEPASAGGSETHDRPAPSTPDDTAGPALGATDELDEATAPADAQTSQQALSSLTASIDTLGQQVRAFHTRAESYEQIIRQMQSRVEELQGDQVKALLKPVIQRLAGLHAQATEAAEQARDRGESAEKDFSFFAVAIEEALGLVDIESVGVSASAQFDPGKQHAARVVPTSEPDLDRRVERVLRQGFTYVGATRVFLPAQVSVYRYEAPPSDTSEPAGDGNNPEIEPGEGASSE